MRIAANNRNNDRYISVPVERQFASAIANFDIADGAKLFGELTYGRVRSNSQIEAFALEWTDVYTDAADLGMAITNPNIPADVPRRLKRATAMATPTMTLRRSSYGAARMTFSTAAMTDPHRCSQPCG